VVLAVLITISSKFLRKEGWSCYGFKSIRQKELIISIIIGIIFGFIDNFVTEPLIARLTGAEPDLSAYSGVKGSISGLFGMLTLGWLVGGVFEEYFFRGYLFYRFSALIKNPELYK
jgi:membrane protease YdiL (CAAX protease family)